MRAEVRRVMYPRESFYSHSTAIFTVPQCWITTALQVVEVVGSLMQKTPLKVINFHWLSKHCWTEDSGERLDVP